MGAISTKKPKLSELNSSSQKQNKSSVCCASPATNSKSRTSANQTTSKQNEKNCTKVVVKFNCGFKNALSIRGEGVKGLNWNRGCPLKNVKADEWCWETNEPFNKAQFKILINDNEYEIGENHIIEAGKSIVFVPNFNHA